MFTFLPQYVLRKEHELIPVQSPYTCYWIFYYFILPERILLYLKVLSFGPLLASFLHPIKLTQDYRSL